MSNKNQKSSVVLSEQVFKDYMFANYMPQLTQETLLHFLQGEIKLEVLVNLAKGLWELPFDHCDGEVILCDGNELLARHTWQPGEDCADCPDLREDESESEQEKYDIFDDNGFGEESYTWSNQETSERLEE